jgi:transposase
MGVPGLNWGMFLRKKKNKSGSISVQIISKAHGTYHVVKSLGSAFTEQGIASLMQVGRQELVKMTGQGSLFVFEQDAMVEGFVSQLHNSQVRTVGPELVFGRIYDSIGFSVLSEDLFRHLVISRLAFPLSKLKTAEYLYRYLGINLEISSIYRFLDKLNNTLKEQAEQIAFKHTLKVLKGNIGIVFYDMTTIYFEASDEDDLRKSGFSKDGKHQNPQIYLGLLVGIGGYAIGYDIYEGNIYEGHTLIPFIEKIAKKFDLNKPIVVADAGLLSQENIKALEEQGYQYILGARVRSESEAIKGKITAAKLLDGQVIILNKEDSRKLIVAYSDKRAAKDSHNRQRGLQRLEKQLKRGRLTKANINNRGYNKYLKINGEVSVEIDYEKFRLDQQWDGLKGYITNTTLKPRQVVENYKNLWHIERAFRMSKTDLRIRPVYHRLARRIEAHICISFVAYAVYKELERILHKEKVDISLKQAAELTHNMYQLTIKLPESLHQKDILLKMDEKQTRLLCVVNKYCRVSH